MQMKEIDKIRIKQWNQDNPYIQMKNLENVQPGYRVHTVNDDHHLYELPLETQNIIQLKSHRKKKYLDIERNCIVMKKSRMMITA